MVTHNSRIQGENMTLHDAIFSIVNDESGGIKFTELIVKLCVYAYDNNAKHLIPNNPEIIEETIRKSKVMKILDYTSNYMCRQKMFVYTP